MVLVVCVNCGCTFNKTPHKIRASAFDFCSTKCCYEYKREHLVMRLKQNDQSMLRVFKSIGRLRAQEKCVEQDE